MGVVDSHCHVGKVWYEPIETLLSQMDRMGVEQALLVQMLGQYDNSYLAECRIRFPARFGFVGAIDLDRGDWLSQVHQLKLGGASGLRLRPKFHVGQDDPLAIWRVAESSMLPVSCVGTVDAFLAPEFVAIIEAVPSLPIVLEHLGATSSPDLTKEGVEMRLAVFQLARYPNLMLKVPGLGEISPRAGFVGDAIPLAPGAELLLNAAYEAFGESRLMWGSDYPVVSSREGYANALAWVMTAFARFPPTVRDKVFGGNARRIFLSH